MTFVIKKVSDHGTSNPIVARMAVQTHEVIQFFNLDKERRDQVLDIYINQVKPRLLSCMEIADAVRQEAEEIEARILRNDLGEQAGGRAIELPQIARLIERVEIYLYNAKSALRDLALTFEPLFGVSFTHSRYNEILAWTVKNFGTEAPLASFLSDDEPWIRRIVNMRNAIEHPGGKQGRLHILNFELIKEDARGRFFQGPVWFLEGEKPAAIAVDLQTMLCNLLTFAEELLVVAHVQLNPGTIIQFASIPEADRNPQCAIRLRAVLDESKMRPNTDSEQAR
jgi:hypothetical protein